MNKQLSLVALLAVASVFVLFLQNKKDPSSEFDQWKLTYGSSLDPSEEVYRKIIFQQNLELVQKHNADPTQTYKMALNQFSIYTQQEFVARFLGEEFEQSSNENIEIETS